MNKNKFIDHIADCEDCLLSEERKDLTLEEIGELQLHCFTEHEISLAEQWKDYEKEERLMRNIELNKNYDEEE